MPVPTAKPLNPNWWETALRNARREVDSWTSPYGGSASQTVNERSERLAQAENAEGSIVAAGQER